MDSKKREKKFLIGDEFLEWAESLIFSMFILILIFIFLFRVMHVVGDSMNPTLKDKDRLILTHIAYTPERGDIVVLNSLGLKKCIIKRCIGISGDIVKINYKNQKVTVNDKEIDEPYINQEEMLNLITFDRSYMSGSDEYEYHVPEGKIFVMGDNRNHSTDSRCSDVGFVDLDDILGKAVFRLMPFKTFGKVK